MGNCYAEVRFWCPPLPQTPLSLVFPRPLNFFILFFFDIYADVKSIYSLGIGHRSTNVDTPYFFYDYCLFFLFFLLLNITLFFFFFCSSTYHDLWIVSDVRLQYGMNVCLLLRSKSATNGILSQKGFSSGTRTAVRRANAH